MERMARAQGIYNVVVIGAGTAGLVTAAGTAGLGGRVGGPRGSGGPRGPGDRDWRVA